MNNNQRETYANITGYPNYQISNFGNCKNVKTGRILKPGTNGPGYLYVILMDDGERSMKRIHKLVAKAFLENPEHKICIDHVDHDRKNNHLSNLMSQGRHFGCTRASKKRMHACIRFGGCIDF